MSSAAPLTDSVGLPALDRQRWRPSTTASERIAPAAPSAPTPLVTLRGASRRANVEALAKLEGFNSTGSVKDRPARFILERAFSSGRLRPGDRVIESSSGNFGVALAAECNRRGVHFTCVVDPNITPMNQMLIRRYGGELSIVTERDAHGGYLYTRIDRVRELLDSQGRAAFWTAQYQNDWNWLAHYHGLGPELLQQTRGQIDYLFASVGTSGTIMGCARALKLRLPDIRVVAVEPIGSVIFGGRARKRHLPGPGSSRVPEILDSSLIDSVVYIDEVDAIHGCHRLTLEDALFVGGSSGLVTRGIERYFAEHPEAARIESIEGGSRRARVAAIFPDRGERYFDTIYSSDWLKRRYGPTAALRASNHS